MRKYSNWILAAGLIVMIVSAKAVVAETCGDKRTLIVVDRSSHQSQEARKALDDGIRTILDENRREGAIEGIVKVFEVRGKSNAVDALVSQCLSPVKTKTQIQTELTAASTKSITERAYEWVFGSKQDNREYNKEYVRKLAATNNEKEKRRRLAVTIDALRAESVQASKDSDMLTPIIHIMRDECNRDVECSLYIFSNMIDERARYSFDAVVKDPKQFGFDRAEQVRKNLGLNKSTRPMQFLIWGFGRDEREDGKDLDSFKVGRLREFWNGALSALNAGANIRLNYRLTQ